MLEVLEEQTAHLLRRARLIRATLMCLLCTIGCLTACSLLSGLSVVWPLAAPAAVVLFVAGMLLLLASVVPAILELRRALDPVELETELVAGLTEAVEARPRRASEVSGRTGHAAGSGTVA